MPNDTTTDQPPVPAAGAADEELDPILNALFDSASDAELPEKLKAAGKKEAGDDGAAPLPPATDTDTAKPDDKPGDEAAKAEKKITRRRRVEQPATPQQQQPDTQPVIQQPTAEETAEREFESALLDEEKDQLDLARRAEAKLGDKYKGFGKKMSKFLKAHQDYIEQAKKEDPDVVFDESNIGYQNFLSANTPRIPPKDMRELDRIEITESVRRENDDSMRDVHDEVFRQAEEPKIKRQADDYFNSLAKSAIPEDIAKVIEAEGIESARKKYPTELRIASGFMEAATNDIEEFIRLTTINPKTKRPFTSYNSKNTQHARLVSFVNQQCDAFKSRGGKLLINKDGKPFATREEYYQMPAEKRDAVWTFSNKQIIDMARVAVKGAIKHAIDTEHTRLANEGWTRATPQPTVVKPDEGADRRPPPAPAQTRIPGKPPAAPQDGDADPMTKLLMGE